MRNPERLVAHIQRYITRRIFAAWTLGLDDYASIYEKASDLVQYAFYGAPKTISAGTDVRPDQTRAR
jgi:hypothetical protein